MKLNNDGSATLTPTEVSDLKSLITIALNLGGEHKHFSDVAEYITALFNHNVFFKDTSPEDVDEDLFLLKEKIAAAKHFPQLLEY